jgi:ribonuclease-3
MKAKTSLKAFQVAIGYQFKDRRLLVEALTHSSYARESPGRIRDNERLEFLGDAVLNLAVSVRLADTFPEYSEGGLSRARARLVEAEHLARVAVSLGLGKSLRLGHGERKTGGEKKTTLLADAIEAIVAAVYRDGGLERAQAFVDRFIIPQDLMARAEELLSVDYKSALQEYLQARGLPLPRYRIVAEQGPEHQKLFTVELTAGGEPTAQGRAGTRKAAEQQAARKVLEVLARRA